MHPTNPTLAGWQTVELRDRTTVGWWLLGCLVGIPLPVIPRHHHHHHHHQQQQQPSMSPIDDRTAARVDGRPSQTPPPPPPTTTTFFFPPPLHHSSGTLAIDNHHDHKTRSSDDLIAAVEGLSDISSLDSSELDEGYDLLADVDAEADAEAGSSITQSIVMVNPPAPAPVRTAIRCSASLDGLPGRFPDDDQHDDEADNDEDNNASSNNHQAQLRGEGSPSLTASQHLLGMSYSTVVAGCAATGSSSVGQQATSDGLTLQQHQTGKFGQFVHSYPSPSLGDQKISKSSPGSRGLALPSRGRPAAPTMKKYNDGPRTSFGYRLEDEFASYNRQQRASHRTSRSPPNNYQRVRAQQKWTKADEQSGAVALQPASGKSAIVFVGHSGWAWWARLLLLLPLIGSLVVRRWWVTTTTTTTLPGPATSSLSATKWAHPQPEHGGITWTQEGSSDSMSSVELDQSSEVAWKPVVGKPTVVDNPVNPNPVNEHDDAGTEQAAQTKQRLPLQLNQEQLIAELKHVLGQAQLMSDDSTTVQRLLVLLDWVKELEGSTEESDQGTQADAPTVRQTNDCRHSSDWNSVLVPDNTDDGQTIPRLATDQESLVVDCTSPLSFYSLDISS